MGIVSEDGTVKKTTKPSPEAEAIDIIENRGVVRENYHNATALSESRDSEIVNKLKAFIPGTPKKVTWFHQITSNATTSSLTTEVSFISDSVNTSFLKIVDMEILLRESFQFSFDEETSQSIVTGECAMYPGLTPKIGDIFFLQHTEGQYGIFKVTDNPQRLTIRNNTSHVVKFALQKSLEDEDITAINERVRETSYFSRQRFLNTDGGLLTEQEVVDLRYIKDKIQQLKRIHHTQYWSQTLETIVINEQVYDPYMVEFYTRCIDAYSGQGYINKFNYKNILPNYNKSIYAFILGESVGGTPLNESVVIAPQYTAFSTVSTMLQGRGLVVLMDAEEASESEEELVTGVTPYISAGILSYDLDAQTDFDKLVSLYVLHKAMSATTWKSLATTVGSMSREEGFYKIPFLIYLGMQLIDALESGGSINLVESNSQPYVNIPFTSLDVTDNVLNLETVLTQALAIINDQGDLVNMDDSYVSYLDGVLSVDLEAVGRLPTDPDITGEWFLVVNNNLNID